MKINRADIVKFYELLNHYNITSTNVGIIGNNKRFKQYIDMILKDSSANSQKYINERSLRIINDDIEICYIQIETEADLVNRYFRKFV